MRRKSGLALSATAALATTLFFQNCSSFTPLQIAQVTNSSSSSIAEPGSAQSGQTPAPTSTATPVTQPTSTPSSTPTPTPAPTPTSPATSTTPFAGMPIQESIFTSYGDSITSGTGASDYLYTAYAPLLATDAGATMHNYGVAGMLSCNIAAIGVFGHPALQVSDGSAYVTLMGGTNDANVGDIGPAEYNFDMCEQASLSWLSIANSAKSQAQSSSCVKTGLWKIDSGKPDAEMVSTTQGDTMDCSISSSGGPIYFWYAVADGNGGTFNYSVDGGAGLALSSQSSVPLTNGNGTEAAGVFMNRIVGLSAGNHHVKFTVTSSTSSSSSVMIFGLGTPSASGLAPHVFVGGVPYQRDDNRSAQTAKFNADVIANVSSLQADGLPVHFVNVRNYLHGTSPEMQDTLHPNNTGHMELKNAFEATIHP